MSVTRDGVTDQRHPELSGLTRTVGLSPKEIADNRREYQKLYARKRRKETDYVERKQASARSRYQKLSPDKKKEFGRRVNLWKHGLSIADYDELLEKQDGVCAICGKPETYKENQNLAVDHDHETGRVRGLLCRKCNLGIGQLQDDPSLLWKALEYLVQHGAKV